MGAYLGIGIATSIYIKRNTYTTNEILNKVNKELDLKIFNINDKYEKYLILDIKKDIFENNIVDLLKEECNFSSKNDKEYIKERIKQIEGKKYDELMKIAKERIAGFSYHAGAEAYLNNISYLANDLKIFCDLIWYVSDGKILFECYYDMFKYFRTHIIKSLKNPLKSAIFVTM